MEIDHLGPEAIAALVDGELSPGAAERASIHLVHCAECRGEVAAQRDVASVMRHAMAEDGLSSERAQPKPGATMLSGLPDALLNRLASIPEQCAAAAERYNSSPSGAQGRNFDIAGRRFPRTLGDKLDLLFHQIRSSGRS